LYVRPLMFVSLTQETRKVIPWWVFLLRVQYMFIFDSRKDSEFLNFYELLNFFCMYRVCWHPMCTVFSWRKSIYCLLDCLRQPMPWPCAPLRTHLMQIMLHCRLLASVSLTLPGPENMCCVTCCIGFGCFISATPYVSKRVQLLKCNCQTDTWRRPQWRTLCSRWKIVTTWFNKILINYCNMEINSSWQILIMGPNWDFESCLE
jgi:hypothetical protein